MKHSTDSQDGSCDILNEVFLKLLKDKRSISEEVAGFMLYLETGINLFGIKSS